MRASTQNPKSKIRNLATLLLACSLFAAGCPKEEVWTAEQKAVHNAMTEWSTAVADSDTEKMWDLLSPDAQDIYRRELIAPGGVRQTFKLNEASLESEMLPEEERKRIEASQAKLPPDPEKMTPAEYYAWRVTRELTPENAENQVRLFAKENVKEIDVQDDKATVVLIHGEPERYSWVRHDGDWKFDLHPSILRALEDARMRERDNE